MYRRIPSKLELVRMGHQGQTALLWLISITQAAVSETSGEKHPKSWHQLIVRPRCLRRIVTQTKQVSGIYGAWCRVSGACRSISVLETSSLHSRGRYGVLGLDDIDHPMIVNCQRLPASGEPETDVCILGLLWILPPRSTPSTTVSC